MDEVTAVKMNFRKEQWKQLILERQASGLSINNWCQQRGFKRTTYFYWLRRIRQEACQTVPDSQAIAPVPFVQIGAETVPNTVSVLHYRLIDKNTVKRYCNNKVFDAMKSCNEKAVRYYKDIQNANMNLYHVTLQVFGDTKELSIIKEKAADENVNLLMDIKNTSKIHTYKQKADKLCQSLCDIFFFKESYYSRHLCQKLIPFCCPERNDEKGFFYGKNIISDNPIIM